MIKSFGNMLTEDLFQDRRRRAQRALPADLYRAARRKILYLHDAHSLGDLRVPPGNRLKALSGKQRGYYSIRINDQFRVVFRWESGDAHDVAVVDYH